MVNGFRYYRALESVSIASALSTALTIRSVQKPKRRRKTTKHGEIRRIMYTVGPQPINRIQLIELIQFTEIAF